MSTWTSSAAAVAFGAILLLAGCDGLASGGTGVQRGQGGVSRNVLQEAELFGGRVVVRGPPGYCIDGDLPRRVGRGGLTLLASCESLKGGADISVEPALMTVSVLPRSAAATPPDAAQIARYAAPARVLEKSEADGISAVWLSGGGDALLPGGDERHWKAGMVVNGHIVGLAVYGRSGSDVAAAEGRRLIYLLAGEIRRASPGGQMP